MNRKYILLLPLAIFTLSSCRKDKLLTKQEALEYVKNKQEEVSKPKSGNLTCSYDDGERQFASLYFLYYLGLKTLSNGEGNNSISEDNLNNYFAYNNEVTGKSAEYVIVGLNETSFKFFSEGDYTFLLQGNNELKISYAKENDSYVRYYNHRLRLTKFEINVNNDTQCYTATQTFTY